MSDAPFHWDRFWFPTGSQVSLIDGYLPDPEGWMGPHLDAQGVKLSALADVPCLILLGVPGIGKTSEMKMAADAAVRAGELVDFIPLARLGGPAELYSQLFATEHRQSWQQGTLTWNIFLDGLDEAVSQINQIEKAIPDLVRQLAAEAGTLQKLRLRISCRSAEWPQALEAELRAIWNTEDVKTFELGHLREKDVKLAATQLFTSNSQQEQFIEYVREHEAQPLASRPITLTMLLNLFRQDSDLPRRQVELYRKGLLASIEEANERRRSNRQTWSLDTQSKLMVAARIAACTVFSNSFEIWTGHQSQVPPARATVLSEIAGGYEPTLGTSFPVREVELKETLLTSLFVPHRTGLFGWSHQTFAEFLAAYYLVEHRLSAEEALHFFQGSSEAIPPQLTETAAWLASMQPDFFRILVRAAPAILLRSDVAAAAPEDREALVKELLQRIDNEELHDFQHDFRSRYERLNHPKLAEQLRPYISNKKKNRIVRRVAIDIAEANKLTELAKLLAEVTLDATDDIHIRSQAAHAIAVSSDHGAKSSLKRLVESDQPEDVDDDLKGYALRALWPDQLSIDELLHALTLPKNSSYFGAYSFFLSELALPSLSEAEARCVLEWCAEILRKDQRHTYFDRVVPRFLARVFEASNSLRVRERFADFLLGAVRDGSYWSYSSDVRKSLSETVLSDSHQNLRRELIILILRRAAADQEHNWSILLGGADPLVAPHDLKWLVELLETEPKGRARPELINLIVMQTFRQQIDQIPFVWEAATANTELSEELERSYSVELSSSVAKWEREEFDRRQKRAAEEQREPVVTLARIERDLAKIEADESFEWWRLNLLLFARSDGRLDPSAEFQSDLTKSHGWGLLSETLRDRVVSSADRYLKENFVPSRPWIGTHTFHRPAAAGYRALRLLHSENRTLYLQLGKRVWRKWAGSILGVSFNDDQSDREVRISIVQRCLELAPAQVLRVVQRLLSKANSEFDVRNLLSWFKAHPDERLHGVLWKSLGQADGRTIRAKPIIQFLLEERYAPAGQLTIDLIGQASPTFSEQISTEDEFVVAAAALIQRDAKSIWSYFSDLRNRNEHLAIEILRNVTDGVNHSDAPFVRDLSEAQLAEFYVWLYRTVPPPPEQSGARFLGFDDHVEQLRNVILNNLIGRGTSDAVAAVQDLSTKLSEVAWLRWKVIDARREVAAKSWQRLSPAEVIAVIASFRPMPSVRSTKEAIKSATAAIQDTLDAKSEDATALPIEAASETVSLPLRQTTSDTAIKPRRILAVATEWRSGHGGLSTLNREFCIALAAVGHDVVCLVINPTQEEIAHAKAVNVRLIGSPADPALQDIERLLLFRPSQLPNYIPEIVIGHDHITGSAAQAIAHRDYNVPNVHFVHTLPEEIEVYKSRAGNSMLRGAEKADIQYQQCLAAQLVVGVGPRIHHEMSTRIASNSDVPVVVMRPGLERKLLNYEVDLTKPRRPYFLFLARLEDGELKGAGLACQMICSLNTDWSWKPPARPRLVMRGFNPDLQTFEKEIAAIGGFKEAIQYLLARPYTADAEQIAADIRSASAIIMPSKREGFGLTALEGIAAGIPVLISSESGLAWLLLEADIQAAIGKATADACVADVDGSPDDIKKDWATRAQAILSDPAKAFSDARKMRTALASLLSWEKAAEKFSADIEKIL